MNSGGMVERRDHVLIGSFELARILRSTLSIIFSSTQAHFSSYRPMATTLVHQPLYRPPSPVGGGSGWGRYVSEPSTSTVTLPAITAPKRSALSLTLSRREREPAIRSHTHYYSFNCPY